MTFNHLIQAFTLCIFFMKKIDLFFRAMNVLNFLDNTSHKYGVSAVCLKPEQSH